MDKSIFIIDDCQLNLSIAKFIINRDSFFDKITSYSEAQKALEDIVRNSNSKILLPDVILLDLNMPVMDGWQFLDRYKEINTSLVKGIDIHILSSSTDAREIQRSKQYDCVKGFFSKPLTPEMLLNMKNSLASAS